jgi:hypothetical protein
MPRPLPATCAAALVALLSATTPAGAVGPPRAIEAAIAAAPFAFRAQVISAGHLPRPGERSQCFVQVRIVSVERGDARPGSVAVVAAPCFAPSAALPTCAFSIPAERLTPGHRFDAAYDGGMLGYTMVNFSYRAAD